LRRQYAFLENENLSIEKELSILRGNTGMLDLEAENQQLRDELGNLSGEIGDYQQCLEDLRSQNNKLLSKLESQREMNDHLKKEMQEIFTQFSALTRCDKTCPSFDLCQKRILIVGGINRMESLYRQLIEENGGIFEYHDGHIKGGKKALENRIMRADIVLCPVNINSHNACSVVKKIGKKHRKSVQMLAGSGLGVISQALSECQEGISTQ
jgi:DNA gyrase/topoisomerase IV subunit A